MGLELPTRWLLIGPPGTGKTLIARLIASQTKRSFYPLTAANVLGAAVGDSVKRVTGVFARAKEHSPSLIFLDEMDGLLPASTQYASQHDIQVVEQFLTEIAACSQKTTSSWWAQLIIPRALTLACCPAVASRRRSPSR